MNLDERLTGQPLIPVLHERRLSAGAQLLNQRLAHTATVLTVQISRRLQALALIGVLKTRE